MSIPVQGTAVETSPPIPLPPLNQDGMDARLDAVWARMDETQQMLLSALRRRNDAIGWMLCALVPMMDFTTRAIGALEGPDIAPQQSLLVQIHDAATKLAKATEERPAPTKTEAAE